MKKLFVGSLPPSTTEESLQALFSEFGTVRSIKLVKEGQFAKSELVLDQCNEILRFSKELFVDLAGHNNDLQIAKMRNFSFDIVKWIFYYEPIKSILIRSKPII